LIHDCSHGTTGCTRGSVPAYLAHCDVCKAGTGRYNLQNIPVHTEYSVYIPVCFADYTVLCQSKIFVMASDGFGMLHNETMRQNETQVLRCEEQPRTFMDSSYCCLFCSASYAGVGCMQIRGVDLVVQTQRRRGGKRPRPGSVHKPRNVSRSDVRRKQRNRFECLLLFSWVPILLPAAHNTQYTSHPSLCY
jgi:hypothetical protein